MKNPFVLLATTFAVGVAFAMTQRPDEGDSLADALAAAKHFEATFEFSMDYCKT